MANVEDNATLLGSERRWQKLAILNDIGEHTRIVRRTRITVGQDVARPQEVENVAHQLLGFHPADMHHHPRRPAAHFTGLDTALQRLKPVLEDEVFGHSHLYPDQEIRVFGEPHWAGFD